jgi:hypothetical protein
MNLLVAENSGHFYSDWPTASLPKRLISVNLNNNNNIAIKSNSSFIYVLTQRVKGQLQNMHSQRDKQNKHKQDNK